MKKLIFVIVCFVSACNLASRGPDAALEVVQPVDYGSGVLYFHVHGASFGKSLSVYLKQHPSLKIQATSLDKYGYWVIVEQVP